VTIQATDIFLHQYRLIIILWLLVREYFLQYGKSLFVYFKDRSTSARQSLYHSPLDKLYTMVAGGPR